MQSRRKKQGFEEKKKVDKIEREEQKYVDGSRSAWGLMLLECIKNLGYKDLVAGKASWIIEREATVKALRDICGHFGDNDWDEHSGLSDVIDRHLGRHLHERLSKACFPFLKS
jgi:hypothetical protein